MKPGKKKPCPRICTVLAASQPFLAAYDPSVATLRSTKAILPVSSTPTAPDSQMSSSLSGVVWTKGPRKMVLSGIWVVAAPKAVVDMAQIQYTTMNTQSITDHTGRDKQVFIIWSRYRFCC